MTTSAAEVTDAARDDAAADLSAPTPPKPLPAPLFGLLVFPFGIVIGYTTIALGYVFEQAHQSMESIAWFQAIAQLPHSYKFLIEPTIDARWKKRSWYLTSIAVGAIFLLVGALMLGRTGGVEILGRHFGLLTVMAAALFISNAGVATSSGALYAVMAVTLPADKKGSASGWAMAGNLGGTGIGGAIGLKLAQHLPPLLAGLIITGLLVLCALPAVFIREPAPPTRPIGATIVATAKDIWKTIRSRAGFLGLLISFSPVGAGGATALFSAIASQYINDPIQRENQVSYVNGLLGGVVSAIGALVGGYIADRMHRQFLYVLAGISTALCAVAMSMMPMTPSVYTVGCLAYQFTNGIAYAAWAAFVLEIMGKDAGVATKHALLAGAANFATSYVTVYDGVANDGKVLVRIVGSGAVGLMRMDALLTVVGVVVIGVAVGIARRFMPRDLGGAPAIAVKIS